MLQPTKSNACRVLLHESKLSRASLVLLCSHFFLVRGANREALIESARRVGSGEEAEQILSGLASFIHPEFFLKRLPGKVRLCYLVLRYSSFPFESSSLVSCVDILIMKIMCLP
jgi:hypothetical protein